MGVFFGGRLLAEQDQSLRFWVLHSRQDTASAPPEKGARIQEQRTYFALKTNPVCHDRYLLLDILLTTLAIAKNVQHASTKMRKDLDESHPPSFGRSPPTVTDEYRLELSFLQWNSPEQDQEKNQKGPH